MNENCKNPYTFLYTDSCHTSEIKNYIEAYKAYITEMNEFCSESDKIISNQLCNNFVENNKFIQNTDIQTNLKKNIPELCKVNTNNDLNELCINKYNIKPDIIIQKEESDRKKEELKRQKNE